MEFYAYLSLYRVDRIELMGKWTPPKKMALVLIEN